MSDKPLLSQTLVRVILALLAAIYVAAALRFARLAFVQPIITPVDFDAFHLAGRMVWEGTIDQAYQWTIFFQREKELGKEIFMPWTYPPPFNLVVAPLGLLPLPIAYVVFIGPALIAYVLTVRHLAGAFLPFALAATCPALVMTIRCGQNGLLTATLLGLMCAGLLKNKPSAGVPLGLMLIKPHLAVTAALIAALQMRWIVLAVASATVLSVVTLCTWLLGPQIWMAFLNATREAKIFLTEGYYPLYRMVSIYAALKSLGFAPSVAFAGQIAVAVSMLGLVTWAALAHLPLRDALGLAVITAPFITPYAYDYDLCLLGVGLALLGPTIERLMSRRAQIALLLLSITGCGVGLVQSVRGEPPAGAEPNYAENLASLGAWPLLLAVALIAYTMWRAQRAPTSAEFIDAAKHSARA